MVMQVAEALLFRSLETILASLFRLILIGTGDSRQLEFAGNYANVQELLSMAEIKLKRTKILVNRGLITGE